MYLLANTPDGDIEAQQRGERWVIQLPLGGVDSVIGNKRVAVKHMRRLAEQYGGCDGIYERANLVSEWEEAK